MFLYLIDTIYIYIHECNSKSSKPRPDRKPITEVECLRGVMVKAMDFSIVISEFELQSHFYVPFRINTFGKGMNPLILPAMR